MIFSRAINFLMFLPLVVLDANKMEYFAPSVFVNHGGGPDPVLGEKDNLEIAESLRNLKNHVELNRLKAIIVVTAHREEEIVTISSGETHELLYDYSNFPPETYTYKYPAPGHPELAREIHAAFTKAAINSQLDDKRGWDHGVFIPMMLINPAANIPIVQVSILKTQKAKEHFDIGRVLYQFREQGVAVIGSGMSYHNMPELRKAEKFSDNVITNREFDVFLNDVCVRGRFEELCAWELADKALYSHPRGQADHLMPLLVNAGAAGDSVGKNIFSSTFRGKFLLSGFIWP